MRNRGQTSMLPMLLVIAGGLLILGAALFALFLRPNSAPETVNETDSGQAPRISLEEAKAAYDSGQAVFVDVRTAESYDQSHIPGALSIPLSELPERINELDVGDWIILY